MRLLITFAVFIVALTQCICNNDNNNENMDEDIKRIYITEREHGYYNFPTILIRSQDSLDSFINDLLPQSSWNEKQPFLDSLYQANIDFDKELLLLLRHTETSGSNTVIVKDPNIEDNMAIIEIDRLVPDVGTDDMAYYCFAYIVSKEIRKITFQIEKMDDIVIEL